MKKHLSRRKFIKQSSCAAIGGTTMLSTLCNLKVMNAAAMTNSFVIGSGDYKAIVCLMLSGGNDSFNMLMPTDSAAYAEYSTARTNLAIPKNQIRSLNGTSLGVHPSMEGIQDLFNDGKLSFLANIGTLIEPIGNKTALYDNSAQVPLGVFSHSDQQQQWQTSIPHSRSAIGWGGKVADILGSQNSNPNISMNISLAGSNIFQKGNNTTEYTLHRHDGSIGIYGYEDEWLFATQKNNAIDNMIESSYQDKFKQAFVDVIRISRDANLEFADALENGPEINTIFSDTDLSASMKMVARTISIRETLGMKRQIFFVESGGWDHHDEVLLAQEEMLREVSDAMAEFNAAMEELNVSDCVTTFSMSEFGRTLNSNGNGTDHGWGGNVMVMGGAVNGGQIYGEYPSLELGSDIELGGGVFIPKLSPDEYFAELALWLGVSSGDLVDLFPNIGNFYSPGSSNNPIGFLNL